ncbi:hypothetical protein KFL_006280100 [Klebsormidium nitens]|uniref:Uncharacterized protein n=1 Tax=Klebsormidium nitens TaxID=105231 RepID=A0A1Y1IHI6_KLENI|nr:hypothetical protein KFL_006280100 [Klebsormidium nitens]|eukprot:GAQ90335.1 hypothetical protein KFL_006280100 [Klebsormidium nitens]
MVAPEPCRLLLVYGDGHAFRKARFAAWFLALKDLDRLFEDPGSNRNVMLLKMRVWEELVLATLSPGFQRDRNRSIYWVVVDEDYGQRAGADSVDWHSGLPEQEANDFLLKIMRGVDCKRKRMEKHEESQGGRERMVFVNHGTIEGSRFVNHGSMEGCSNWRTAPNSYFHSASPQSSNSAAARRAGVYEDEETAAAPPKRARTHSQDASNPSEAQPNPSLRSVAKDKPAMQAPRVSSDPRGILTECSPNLSNPNSHAPANEKDALAAALEAAKRAADAADDRMTAAEAEAKKWEEAERQAAKGGNSGRPRGRPSGRRGRRVHGRRGSSTVGGASSLPIGASPQQGAPAYGAASTAQQSAGSTSVRGESLGADRDVAGPVDVPPTSRPEPSQPAQPHTSYSHLEGRRPLKPRTSSLAAEPSTALPTKKSHSADVPPHLWNPHPPSAPLASSDLQREMVPVEDVPSWSVMHPGRPVSNPQAPSLTTSSGSFSLKNVDCGPDVHPLICNPDAPSPGHSLGSEGSDASMQKPPLLLEHRLTSPQSDSSTEKGRASAWRKSGGGACDVELQLARYVKPLQNDRQWYNRSSSDMDPTPLPANDGRSMSHVAAWGAPEHLGRKRRRSSVSRPLEPVAEEELEEGEIRDDGVEGGADVLAATAGSVGSIETHAKLGAGFIIPGQRFRPEDVPVQNRRAPRAPLPHQPLVLGSPLPKSSPLKPSATSLNQPLLLTYASEAQGAPALSLLGGGGIGSWKSTTDWAQPMTGRTAGFGRKREESAGDPGSIGEAVGGAAKITYSSFSLAQVQREQVESDDLPSELHLRRRNAIEWWAENPLADEPEEGEFQAGKVDERIFPLTVVAAQAEQSVVQTKVSGTNDDSACSDDEYTEKDASDTNSSLSRESSQRYVGKGPQGKRRFCTPAIWGIDAVGDTVYANPDIPSTNLHLMHRGNDVVQSFAGRGLAAASDILTPFTYKTPDVLDAPIIRQYTGNGLTSAAASAPRGQHTTALEKPVDSGDLLAFNPASTPTQPPKADPVAEKAPEDASKVPSQPIPPKRVSSLIDRGALSRSRLLYASQKLKGDTAAIMTSESATVAQHSTAKDGKQKTESKLKASGFLHKLNFDKGDHGQKNPSIAAPLPKQRARPRQAASLFAKFQEGPEKAAQDAAEETSPTKASAPVSSSVAVSAGSGVAVLAAYGILGAKHEKGLFINNVNAPLAHSVQNGPSLKPFMDNDPVSEKNKPVVKDVESLSKQPSTDATPRKYQDRELKSNASAATRQMEDAGPAPVLPVAKEVQPAETPAEEMERVTAIAKGGGDAAANTASNSLQTPKEAQPGKASPRKKESVVDDEGVEGADIVANGAINVMQAEEIFPTGDGSDVFAPRQKLARSPPGAAKTGQTTCAEKRPAEPFSADWWEQDRLERSLRGEKRRKSGSSQTLDRPNFIEIAAMGAHPRSAAKPSKAPRDAETDPMQLPPPPANSDSTRGADSGSDSTAEKDEAAARSASGGLAETRAAIGGMATRKLSGFGAKVEIGQPLVSEGTAEDGWARTSGDRRRSKRWMM